MISVVSITVILNAGGLRRVTEIRTLIGFCVSLREVQQCIQVLWDDSRRPFALTGEWLVSLSSRFRLVAFQLGPIHQSGVNRWVVCSSRSKRGSPGPVFPAIDVK